MEDFRSFIVRSLRAVVHLQLPFSLCRGHKSPSFYTYRENLHFEKSIDIENFIQFFIPPPAWGVGRASKSPLVTVQCPQKSEASINFEKYLVKYNIRDTYLRICNTNFSCMQDTGFSANFPVQSFFFFHPWPLVHINLLLTLFESYQSVFEKFCCEMHLENFWHYIIICLFSS